MNCSGVANDWVKKNGVSLNEAQLFDLVEAFKTFGTECAFKAQELCTEACRGAIDEGEDPVAAVKRVAVDGIYSGT